MCTAMEDDACMSELVEFIFGKKATIFDETVAHSSVSSNFLTEDFSVKLAIVLGWRKHLIRCRYFISLLDEWHKLSSRNKYLGCVISSCLCEHECNRNIFDAFISVCSVLTHFSEEALARTGVDFSDLNPDILMVFYWNVLKGTFITQRGLYPFVEYIRGHEYLKWNSDGNGHTLTADSAASSFLQLNERVNEECNRYRPFQEVSEERGSAMEALGKSMVNEILSKTSVELPILPNEPDPIARPAASGRQEMAENADDGKQRVEAAAVFEVSRGYSSSDAETCYLGRQQQDIARHENIIQAVIRHNHSKNLGDKNANLQIHEKADGILKNLKNAIKSLVKVIDECGN